MIGLFAAAQKADLDIRVSKPRTISILPVLRELHSGYSYEFTVTGLAPGMVTRADATFGEVTSLPSKDGKSLALKVTVVGSGSSRGTIRILDDKNKVLATQDYKIVATIRYTDYVPNVPGSVKPSPVILFLGKDTLADNGTIPVGKLRSASMLSLFDGKIPPAAIRRNLMCKITLMHDTFAIVAHSALNYLSDKVKQTLSKAQPGDRIYITAMETLWIDADRSDHITPYGDLTYTLTVSE